MELLKKYKIPIFLTAIFIVIFALIISGLFKGIDDTIDSWSRSITNKTVHSFFITITNLGSTKIILGISLLVLLFTFNKLNNFRVFTLLVSSSLGCYLINAVIKNIVQRARPPLPHLVIEHTYSFPSGHAMVSMCFYSIVAFIITKIFVKNRLAIKVTLFALAIAIAISRVILHVHYFSDVLAGAVLGFALYLFLKKFLPLGPRTLS